MRIFACVLIIVVLAWPAVLHGFARIIVALIPSEPKSMHATVKFSTTRAKITVDNVQAFN